MSFEIRSSRPDDAARTFEIWRDSVEATHDFLSEEDFAAITTEVAAFLPSAPLALAVDGADRPVGFMLVADGKLEALFIDPAVHGDGVGRLLVENALADYPELTTDVNEQNPGAIGFYEHMGFRQTGRSDFDDQGRPYPLLHMRFSGDS